MGKLVPFARVTKLGYIDAILRDDGRVVVRAVDANGKSVGVILSPEGARALGETLLQASAPPKGAG